MSQELAKVIVVSGFAIGLAFWFVAVVLYRKMANGPTRERIDFNMPDRTPSEAINGLLANGRLATAETRLHRPAEDQLTIVRSGVETTITANRRRGGVELVAEIDSSTLTRWFQFGFAIFVLIVMPAVIGGTTWALWNFVVLSESSGVRAQSLQILQIVHVLWPPFLIFNVWKQRRRAVVNAVANALVLAQAGGLADRDTQNVEIPARS